jgi:hypothetical protein
VLSAEIGRTQTVCVASAVVARDVARRSGLVRPRRPRIGRRRRRRGVARSFTSRVRVVACSVTETLLTISPTNSPILTYVTSDLSHDDDDGPETNNFGRSRRGREPERPEAVRSPNRYSRARYHTTLAV